jgi:hypothetical protein
MGEHRKKHPQFAHKTRTPEPYKEWRKTFKVFTARNIKNSCSDFQDGVYCDANNAGAMTYLITILFSSFLEAFASQHQNPSTLFIM